MPYGRMRMKTTKINPRSPYGRLLLEKQEVERLCKLQEQQIAAEWQYVQNNAGRLLMSGFASVFSGDGRTEAVMRAGEAERS